MKKELFFQKIGTVFGVDDPESLRIFCNKYWPEETTHVMKVAEDVCNNVFLFDFPWDMERTWKPVCFQETIDWNLIPWDDREFLWQFNRHRFLLCLGQAYLLSGDEKYAVHLIRLIQDWIEHAKEEENIDLGPWRTLETGLRIETWLRSLSMVMNSGKITDQMSDLIIACLMKHGKRLEECFSANKYLSNWGVLESSGLFLLSIALEEETERAEEWRETALKRLVYSAQIQVLQDGTQWEQSPMYHNEVYQCFRNVLYYGKKSGITLPQEIYDTVRNMAYVDGIWMKPDHTQFTQGDSDATDLRSQITAGAWVLKDPVLKYWGYQILDYESAWQFGYDACMEYAAMEAMNPAFVSAQLPFSGNYYFRSSWQENGNLLHFRCGDTGGGHGHGDKLHVDLVINGEDILVDAGRSTYVDNQLRYELKEPAAHNVALVDQIPFSQCESSWVYKNLCSCMKQQYYEGKMGAFVEGSHLGYLEKGVLVNRQVIWIKPDIFVLVDHFYGEGRHSYESFFHFDRKGKVFEEEYGVHFLGKCTEAWLQVISGDGDKRIQTTKQSLYYNEIGENKTLSINGTAEGNFHRITVINGGPEGAASSAKVDKLEIRSAISQKEVPAEQAEALRICIEDREYILLICHQEIMTPIDILQFANCMGYGKAVLFDRTHEKEEPLAGEVLAWW